MWNKIGSWLDYPNTWCEFVIRIGVLLLITLFVVVFIAGMSVLPILLFTDIIKTEQVGGNFRLGLISLFFWFMGAYMFLLETTKWCHNLLDKIPDCLKIKWNK